MPDKLTDNEIIKALRSWLEEIRKARQAYLEKNNEEHYPSMRYEYLLSDTIHEINRQKAEIDNLKNDELPKCKDALRRANEIGMELQTEIERLKIVENGFIELQKLYRTAKAEAYKEFAERLKEKLFEPVETWLTSDVVREGDIDNLLKEMVGEK